MMTIRKKQRSKAHVLLGTSTLLGILLLSLSAQAVEQDSACSDNLNQKETCGECVFGPFPGRDVGGGFCIPCG
jgi:hypothetical protein